VKARHPRLAVWRQAWMVALRPHDGIGAGGLISLKLAPMQ
jgi:hypothetical protein